MLTRKDQQCTLEYANKQKNETQQADPSNFMEKRTNKLKLFLKRMVFLSGFFFFFPRKLSYKFLI